MRLLPPGARPLQLPAEPSGGSGHCQGHREGDGIHRGIQAGTGRQFAERLQEIIDRYNAGSTSSDRFYDELVRYTKTLKQEAERHVREGLTEDELEIYDLLAKDKMTEAETQQMHRAARSLLHRLKEETPPVLVQDWYRDSQTQQVVRSAIGEVLDEHLPATYERGLFTEKRDSVFDLILDLASHGRKWAA